MSLFSFGNLRMAMMEKVKVVMEKVKVVMEKVKVVTEKVKVVMERVVMEKVVTRMKRIRFAIE